MAEVVVAQFEVLCWYLPRGTEEDHEKSHSAFPPGYKQEALLTGLLGFWTFSIVQYSRD
jgi:hypothetical protein